jgi:hypothetical protein
MFVKGSSLGVILDVSGSMTSFLPALRENIRNQFPNAVFLEVAGCSLSSFSEETPGFGFTEPGDGPKRGSVMEAIHELIKVSHVDSIYWFCDLQDVRTDDAIHELRELVAGRPVAREMPATANRSSGQFSRLDELKRMNANRPNRFGRPVFHLYIRSVGESPDPPLERVIEESGGSFQLER